MDDIRLVLECDQDVADDLAAALTREVDATVSSATKRHLDGAAETTLQIAQIAFTFGGMVVPVLLPWLQRDRVRKIRLGDLEIDNPTAEQVETLWQRYLEDHPRDDPAPG